MTLERKLKRREGLRLVFHNNLKSAEEYLSNEDVEEAKLKAFKTMLSKSIEQLSDVDDEVVALLDPDAVPDDIVESMQMQGKATFVESEIDVRLSQIVKANESTSSLPLSTPSVSSISNVSRLPKIELPVFKGDPVKWQGFWDHFSALFDDSSLGGERLRLSSVIMQKPFDRGKYNHSCPLPALSRNSSCLPHRGGVDSTNAS